MNTGAILRGVAMVEYKQILYCTDFSEDADIAFYRALSLAKKHSAQLHVLHVRCSSGSYMKQGAEEHVPEASPRREAFFDEKVTKDAEEALKNRYEGKLGDFKDCTYVVKSGAPDIEIIRYAKKHDIDVIVMGAMGKAEQDRMIHGSTVANVSKYAPCHVIAIRNPAKQFTLPGSMY